MKGSDARANVAVTLLSSSGVSCAVCFPSLALSQCSCRDGGASGTETDAAETHRLLVTSALIWFEQVQPKVCGFSATTNLP